MVGAAGYEERKGERDRHLRHRVLPPPYFGAPVPTGLMEIVSIKCRGNKMIPAWRDAAGTTFAGDRSWNGKIL